MSCGIHINDIGTEFRVTVVDCDGVAIDISDATIKQISFKKPDGSTVTKDASFYTDGTDGIISYVSESGVLNQTGSWKIQAQITGVNGNWNSIIKTFKVLRNL